MYSAYKLNKQGEDTLPWRTLYPIWNQSVVPCPVLSVASWPEQVSQEAGQVVWYSHLSQNFPQFSVIHTVKGFGIVNKAEIDVFLELPCFFDDLADVGNLISGSSTFSKFSLNIWKFTVHVLLKLGLKNFEHYSACYKFYKTQERYLLFACLYVTSHSLTKCLKGGLQSGVRWGSSHPKTWWELEDLLLRPVMPMAEKLVFTVGWDPQVLSCGISLWTAWISSWPGMWLLSEKSLTKMKAEMLFMTLPWG